MNNEYDVIIPEKWNEMSAKRGYIGYAQRLGNHKGPFNLPYLTSLNLTYYLYFN